MNIRNIFVSVSFVLGTNARTHASNERTQQIEHRALTDSLPWILSIDYCAPNNLYIYFFLLFLPTPESRNTQQTQLTTSLVVCGATRQRCSAGAAKVSDEI